MLYLVAPAQQHRKSVKSIWIAILSQNVTDAMVKDDDCSASRRQTALIMMLHQPMPDTDPPSMNNIHGAASWGVP